MIILLPPSSPSLCLPFPFPLSHLPQAAMTEDRLHLKLVEAPLGLCGSLLSAIADSQKLRHLAIDMVSEQNRAGHLAIDMVR